jgi:hypothetical protein
VGKVATFVAEADLYGDAPGGAGGGRDGIKTSWDDFLEREGDRCWLIPNGAMRIDYGCLWNS